MTENRLKSQIAQISIHLILVMFVGIWKFVECVSVSLCSVAVAWY